MNGPAALLVDERTGLVRRVVPDARRDGFPRSYTAATAQVAGTGQFANWRADPTGHGSAFDDPEGARAAALGEAVERYCGNAPPSGVRVATFDQLEAGGVAVLDPQAVPLYSIAQYAAPGFPFVPMTRDLPMRWVPARPLDRPSRSATTDTSGDTLFVPASLVVLNPGHDGLPATNLQMYAGIAAATTPADARHRAMLEVVERDALTVWWLGGGPTVALDGVDAQVEALLAARPARHGLPESLTATVLAVPNRLGLPVVAALVDNPRDGTSALGAACRTDTTAALRKALLEALDGLAVAAELLDPTSALWRAVAGGAAYAHPYRPFRADRGYGADYRTDLRDVHDLACHTQLYLDPSVRQRLLPRLRRPQGRVSAADLDAAAHTTGGPLQALLAAGLQPLWADLSTPDVRLAGLHVARVVVPGLAAYAPAAFPLLGVPRLYTEPVSLGWTSTPPREEDLVLDPLPYS
ncbi:ribosomal protein S12 methylthiotransferase accessory factor [Micromonospora sp. Llam0]|uniref:YcaO-like family protein n=1 Tax=Micromonospora sp. Llam0 TaxID=2485143 RepID=UPI000F467064|nr:YcaO-like family protein [Micromonospora sp. Llam0]ROO60498.1 ribosomal protein S12 methylthiotransferase accessory factor [Micromonospora sp. Llam0]